MRFSRRTAWDLTPSALSRLLDSLRSRRPGLLDLTETNPTRVGLGPDPAAVLEALREPGALLFDPQPLGSLAAREAVSRYHAGRVPPGHVALTASTSESYAALFKLLCDPGDRVLVPAPSYPLFEYLAGLEAVALDSYPLRYADGWYLDAEALEAAVQPATRAVLLVSPSNPSGAVVRRGELERVAETCRRHGLALVCDEVFAEYLHEPEPDMLPTLAGFSGTLTFVLAGLSKSCLLPQLKLGWMAVSGPAPERDEALARLEVILDTFLSVNAPVQAALAALLSGRGRAQAPLKARLSANRAVLGAALRGSSASLLRSGGGWSAVLRVPRARAEEEWVRVLAEEEGVLVHPGWFYDFATEGHLVVSLLPGEGPFAEAASRLARVFAPEAAPE